MTTAATSDSLPAAMNSVARKVLLLAVWFGLVTGLVEGAGLLTFQRLGWLAWVMSKDSVADQILWVSPLFNLLYFGGLGLLLALAARRLPRWPAVRITAALAAFLLFLDWLLLSGRIRHSGALVLAVGLAVTFDRWYRRHAVPALTFFRKTLPTVVALTVVAFVWVEGGRWWREWNTTRHLPAAAPGTPNVLLIVTDTLRADHLSAYGYGRPTSPHIDQLAREGVLFEQAFATSSWTLPSHASMLTGLYPFEHGAVRNKFDGRHIQLSQALLARGYRTGAFSANLAYFTRHHGFEPGFLHFEDTFATVTDMAARTVYGRKFEQFVLHRLGMDDHVWRRSAASINASLVRWIDAQPGKPFFAMVNYFDIHDPYLPPHPWRSRFSKSPNPGGIINTFAGRNYPDLTPEQLQSEVDAYDGGINYVDEQFGKLLGELERRGLKDNTLIIFTSDHGESFGEHGLLHHRNALYQEVLHVPLIFRLPGKVPAGVRAPQTVSIASIPATVLDLLDAPDVARFPTPSLAPVWNDTNSWPEWTGALAEIEQMPFRGIERTPAYRGTLRSLIDSQWHYISHPVDGEELYDRKSDPQQLNNLARTEEGWPVAAKFAARLKWILVHPRTETSHLPASKN